MVKSGPRRGEELTLPHKKRKMSLEAIYCEFRTPSALFEMDVERFPS
jgi:hypothetical protein